LEIEIFVNS